MTEKKTKRVEIEWDDATFNSGFYEEDKPQKFQPIPMKTIGYLIKSSPKEIITSTDQYPDEVGKPEYRHISTIPRKMVKRITYL